MTFNPIFETNCARSGGGLFRMLLSSHKAVQVASDPFLEVHRSLRNAIIRHSGSPELRERFDPSSPIQDYYYTDERIQTMDLIQAGTLDTPFDPHEWDQLLERCVRRAGLESGDLAPHLDALRGATYRDIFDNGLEMIAKHRDAMDSQWVGSGDTWAIEFFAPLARAYPEARFLVNLRDPRASVASMLKAADRWPEQVAHAVSYGRHWRKYVALILRFQNDPLFENRLLVTTHEQLSEEPEETVQQVCAFLGVEFDPMMLDTENYYDFNTGSTWAGNSSFEQVTSGISVHRTQRWRTHLDAGARKTIDLLCGPEMALVGYEPEDCVGAQWPDPDVLDYIIQSDKAYANWRTDMGDPQLDYGFELFRRAMLNAPDGTFDEALIRRSFLFREVFDRLRQTDNRTRITSRS